MSVLMMRIVDMAMLMFQHIMLMFVRVAFAEVHPQPEAHDSACDNNLGVKRFN